MNRRALNLATPRSDAWASSAWLLSALLLALAVWLPLLVSSAPAHAAHAAPSDCCCEATAASATPVASQPQFDESQRAWQLGNWTLPCGDCPETCPGCNSGSSFMKSSPSSECCITPPAAQRERIPSPTAEHPVAPDPASVYRPPRDTHLD